MLNDTERVTKMKFVNLTIEFDKVKPVVWASGLISVGGWGRNEILVAGIKVKK